MFEIPIHFILNLLSQSVNDIYSEKTISNEYRLSNAYIKQVGRDLVRSLIQPLAQNRVNGVF